MYILFRKLFDQVDDRENRLKKLEEFSDDFSPDFFNGDISTTENISETVEMSGSCIHGLDNRQLKPMYEYLCNVKKLDAFFSILRKYEEAQWNNQKYLLKI